MRIEYQKPWFLKSKSSETNILVNRNFSLSVSFKVEKNFKKDDKIGFLGIPGKNFGISYDYEVDAFVFEFWTKKPEGEPEFHCFVYDHINETILAKGVTITITFDGNNFILYKDFRVFDTIQVSNPLIEDYNNEPLYLGCHNLDSLVKRHACYTEMEITHLSIFDGVIPMSLLKSYVLGEIPLITGNHINQVLCYFTFEDNTSEDLLIYDGVKDLYFLKKRNKMSMVGFKLAKDKLDSVGCGFCLAKWTQVTMHLHNGTTHSCHHPIPHKVGLEEVSRNPTALHNSKIKKQARKEMLEGKRPSECGYCWNVEDNTNSYSDRVFKSSEPWSEPHFDDIAKSDWRDDFNPKYVEVSFSNTCNFKCAYCGPEYSSKWMEEVTEHGAYMLSHEYNGIRRLEENKTKPYKHTEHNPYVEAFWEWWPDMYNSLDTFRITGGEPLLSKDTWKVLDYIIESENPNKELKLSINSNLGVPDELVDKLILKLDQIIKEERVKEVIIFTSCDAYGAQAEYSRYGMDFDKVFNNIDKILTKLEKVTVVIMSTFNIFSVYSYEKLIKKVYSYKVKHFNTVRYWNSPLILDTSFLINPDFLSFRILKDYLDVEYFERWEKYMKFNSTFRSLNFHKTQDINDVGFSTKEIEKITRIKEMFVTDAGSPERTFERCKLDFLNFIKEYEKRRGMKCEEYFPELTKFIKDIEYENKI